MTSKRILIFDTECNSLDRDYGYIQELAWAVYDTSSWRLLSCQSKLLKWGVDYEVDKGAFNATGLTHDFCEQHGESPDNVFSAFLGDTLDVSYVCAHNLLGYDDQMLKSNIRRTELYSMNLSIYDDKLKIDTLIDCPYPDNTKFMSLKYLALDHGYFHPYAHQAMTDVFACKHILSNYDFRVVEKIASTPIIMISSKIDFEDVESREKLKASKFRWNSSKKVWEKKVREFFLKDYQLSLGDILTQSELASLN